MAEPFLGEIRMMSFNFPPKYWAFCNGQLLPINQNQGLFSLLGTTYGGNGSSNFALPDLQGRVPVHRGDGFTLGERSGESVHTLSISELPTHTHEVNGTSNIGSSLDPTNNLPAGSIQNIYSNPANLVSMNPTSLVNVGGSQAHPNMQPFLAISFCIALVGIFPAQN